MLELNDDGDMEKTSSALKSGIGFALAFVIYMFIFIYGSMVMRSAMEEKTNRIVEVIVSSVKPFELMMGKIIGVAFVGLTQFIAWITLSVAFVTALSQYITGGKSIETAEMSSLSASEIKGMELLAGLDNITVFVLFFLGGYLLYSSIFAAIGASVNQETDVQQFMLPVSLPLVFSLVIAQSVVFQAPNGKLAQIFSMIPLSSPVVMSVRAPFGVPIMEIISSFVILLISFLIMVWLTARIYRIGILMYGKKPSWKDFLRWIRQS
jgi:ABC-2 type transport system permease protein